MKGSNKEKKVETSESTFGESRTPTAALGGRPYAWVVFFCMMVLLLIRQDDATTTTTTNAQGIQRGQILGPVVTASDLYHAYREIQQDYHAKAFGRKDWIVLNKNRGVEVSMLQHPSDPSCPYVKMTAFISVPPEDCWEFLEIKNWDKTMPKMDPFYEGVQTYASGSDKNTPFKHKGVTMRLARKRTKRLLALGKRDFFFVSVADVPLSDGTLVSGTVSVVAPQLVPRQKGYTRAFQDSIAFYQPVEEGKGTFLTIICRIDLNDSGEDGEGGFMPMWLYVKTIGATGVRSVLSMRNALEREHSASDVPPKVKTAVEAKGFRALWKKAPFGKRGL